MKAVSLWPPFGSLIAAGIKSIETRSWATRYRGRIAIYQTKTWDRGVSAWYSRKLAMAIAPEIDWPRPPAIPLGAVVATAWLSDCVPTSRLAGSVTEVERLLGDYSPGRYGWILEDVVELPEPIPATGRQGLWNWE